MDRSSFVSIYSGFGCKKERVARTVRGRIYFPKQNFFKNMSTLLRMITTCTDSSID